MRILVSGSVNLVASIGGPHLGHLLTPRNNNSVGSVVKTGLPWAVDNGAFSGFETEPFRRLVRRAAGKPGLLFVACPDVVGNARGTLALFGQWQPEMRDASIPVAFVGQDGIEDEGIPWGAFSTWFVGGSTRWKLSQASADLCQEARKRGKHVHVGRVTTLRRLTAAYDMGADTVDGSNWSKMPDKFLSWGTRWVRILERQGTLFGGRGAATTGG